MVAFLACMEVVGSRYQVINYDFYFYVLVLLSEMTYIFDWITLSSGSFYGSNRAASHPAL